MALVLVLILIMNFHFIFMLLAAAAQSQCTSLLQYPHPLTEFGLVESKSGLNDYVFIYSHLNSRFYSTLLIQNNILFSSGINYVFKLNSDDITDFNENVYLERRLAPVATFNSSNSITFLGLRQSKNDLIVCVTNNGNPLVLHLKLNDLTYLIQYHGIELCSVSDKHNSLGLLSFYDTYLHHEPEGVMYSAVWTNDGKEHQQSFSDSRYGIFRKYTQISKSYARTLHSPIWLWDPDFIYIYEDTFNVYYFFTEYSIEEYANERGFHSIDETYDFRNINKYPTRWARVARTCKNDKTVGNLKIDRINFMWTSFRKVKIECACGSDRTKFRFNNLALVHQLGSDQFMAIFHEDLIYFTDDTNRSSSRIYSVIAEFDYNALLQTFKTKEFWQYRGQTEPKFNSHECDDNDALHISRSGGTTNNNNNNNNNNVEVEDNSDESVAHDYYEFLTKNTILNTKLTVECKLVLPYKITSVTSEIINKHQSILFMSTDNGSLVKVLRETDRKEEAANVYFKVLSKWTFKNDSNEITKLTSSDHSLYATSSNAIFQIKHKNQCFRYTYCVTCMQDPYCEWLSSKEGCANRDSKQIQENPNYATNLNEYCNRNEATIKNTQLNATINQTIVLNCFSHSFNVYDEKFGRVKVKWWKNNHQILNYKNTSYLFSINGDLIIVSIDKSYVGNYTCAIQFNQNLLQQVNKFIISLVDTATTIGSTSTRQTSTSLLSTTEESTQKHVEIGLSTKDELFSIHQNDENTTIIKVYCCDEGLFKYLTDEWKIEIENYLKTLNKNNN